MHIACMCVYRYTGWRFRLPEYPHNDRLLALFYRAPAQCVLFYTRPFFSLSSAPQARPFSPFVIAPLIESIACFLLSSIERQRIVCIVFQFYLVFSCIRIVNNINSMGVIKRI